MSHTKLENPLIYIVDNGESYESNDTYFVESNYDFTEILAFLVDRFYRNLTSGVKEASVYGVAPSVTWTNGSRTQTALEFCRYHIYGGPSSAPGEASEKQMEQILQEFPGLI